MSRTDEESRAAQKPPEADAYLDIGEDSGGLQ